MTRFNDALSRLQAVITDRVGADATSSYTAKLLAGGAPLAAKKFGEEAVETALAAVLDDSADLASESADMLYHWLVLLTACRVSLDEVADRLEAREGRSGLDEKASRAP